MKSFEQHINEIQLRDIIREITYDYLTDMYDIPIQPLDEGLIYSYDARRVMFFLSNKYHLVKSERQFNRVAGCDGIIKIRNLNNHCKVILIALKINSPKWKPIVHDMETRCGWFRTKPFTPNIKGYEGWQFEKRFDNPADDEVKEHRYLYHLCPNSRLKKILSIGLVPKQTTWAEYKEAEPYSDKSGEYGWKSVERIYLFLNRPSNYFIQHNNFADKELYWDKPALLRIDTQKLPQSDSIRFYYDPRSKGIFTLENIPVNAIEVVDISKTR